MILKFINFKVFMKVVFRTKIVFHLIIQLHLNAVYDPPLSPIIEIFVYFSNLSMKWWEISPSIKPLRNQIFFYCFKSYLPSLYGTLNKISDFAFLHPRKRRMTRCDFHSSCMFHRNFCNSFFRQNI